MNLFDTGQSGPFEAQRGLGTLVTGFFGPGCEQRDSEFCKKIGRAIGDRHISLIRKFFKMKVSFK